jgi:hypothetical protein
MSINSPRFSGWYPQRQVDCERAVERDFLREIVNISTPYVDLDRVLTGLAEDATKAGWTEGELTDSLISLAMRHNLKPADTRV